MQEALSVTARAIYAIFDHCELWGGYSMLHYCIDSVHHNSARRCLIFTVYILIRCQGGNIILMDNLRISQISWVLYFHSLLYHVRCDGDIAHTRFDIVIGMFVCFTMFMVVCHCYLKKKEQKLIEQKLMIWCIVQKLTLWCIVQMLSSKTW